MGRNETGVMAALTNRRSDQPPPDEPRSRGEIVMGLLQQTTPEAAYQWMKEQELTRFRPFNVVFGDRNRFYVFGDKGFDKPKSLQPGNYALSNSHLDDITWPKVARSHAFLSETAHLPGEALLSRLHHFLGDSSPPDQEDSEEVGLETHGAFGAVFIRHPDYGTVSSSIYTAGSLGERMYYAEGPDLERDPPTAFRLIPMES